MESITDGIRAVIFDFDGTLYHPKGMKKRLVLSSIFHLSLVLRDRKFRRIYKGVDFGSADEFRRAYVYFLADGKKSSFEKVSSWKNKVYMPSMTRILEKGFPARSDIFEVFNKLHEQGIKTAVFSDYDFVPERVAAIGADGISGNLFSSEELGLLKPCPRGFFEIARILDVAPSEVLVVGDRDDTDGQGARNCGMKFIHILNKDFEKKEADGVDAHRLSWENFSRMILS